MTDNEKIKCAIRCFKVNADMEVCEECEAYTSGDLACRDIAREAIKALEEVQEYRKIGTVEECREAVRKTKEKKCIQDSCPDHTHYKCPSCGKIQMSEYKRGIRILGRITNNCDNCGQRLESGE